LALGQLLVSVFGSDFDSLADVRVSLEPEVGAPTFYRDGVAVPDASVTLEGDAPAQGPGGWPFALFTNLPEGEYVVRSERDDLRCRALDDWRAYADSHDNALRAPVLADTSRSRQPFATAWFRRAPRAVRRQMEALLRSSSARSFGVFCYSIFPSSLRRDHCRSESIG